MIDSHNEWWAGCCEQAERTTAKQIGIPSRVAFGSDIGLVREAVAKMMAPKAANASPPHRSASVRTALMLAATNKKRAELGQPLIALD